MYVLFSKSTQAASKLLESVLFVKEWEHNVTTNIN